MLGGKVKLPRPLPPDPADRKCMSGKMSGSVRVACWGGGPFTLSGYYYFWFSYILSYSLYDPVKVIMFYFQIFSCSCGNTFTSKQQV